jgi:hypothetical protein
MGTLSLQMFLDPNRLVEIKPRLLLDLLAPHEQPLAARGFNVPATSNVASLDCTRLVEALSDPDALPTGLLDLLHLICEVANAEGMDAIVAAATERGLDLGPEPDDSPADIAVRAALMAPDLLNEKHAEAVVGARSSFATYQASAPGDMAVAASKANLAKMGAALDDWFEQRNRGRHSSVRVLNRGDEVWFLVRHGGTFQRAESVRDVVPFRPAVYDALIYHKVTNELSINAGSAGEIELYRQEFGRQFFKNTEHFPVGDRYTLEPLIEKGADALACGHIDGMRLVVLREVHVYYGGEFGEVIVHKARDVFEARKARQPAIPSGQRLLRAVFEVAFTDSRRTRRVHVAPPNVARYTRKGDCPVIEAWLGSAGFVVEHGGRRA